MKQNLIGKSVEVIKSAKRILEALVQTRSVKKVFLEISQNSQGNTFARVSFFNFVKFLRTPFYTEHIWWLLLEYVKLEACVYYQILASRDF